MFNTASLDRAFRLMDFDSSFNTRNFDYDIQEDDTSFTLISDLPGMDKKDIDISLENRLLTISAIRKKEDNVKYVTSNRWFGMNKNNFRLNFNVEEKDISAEYSNGVLKVKIPKSKTSSKKIEIN